MARTSSTRSTNPINDQEARPSTEPKRSRRIWPWLLIALLLGLGAYAAINSASLNVVLAVPSVLAMLAYAVSPIFTRSARNALKSTNGLPSPPNSDPGMLRQTRTHDETVSNLPGDGIPAWLDWAIDYTQILFVIFVPVAALLLVKPNEQWALVVAVALPLVVVVVALILRDLPPERYKPIRALWGLTWVSLFGVVVNGLVAALLGFGWLAPDEPAARPLPEAQQLPLLHASEIIEPGPVEHDSTSTDPSLFRITLTVHGGIKALGGRFIWLANLEDPDAGPQLFFSRRPCVYQNGETWTCAAFLGQATEKGAFKLYASLVNDGQLSAILDGWHEHPIDGHFAPPLNSDAKMFTFDRTR